VGIYGEILGDLAGATTSRPSPARFAACYSSLAEAGATGVVSIHLSSELSGTVESARAAALDAPVPVEVVDSRAIAMGLGYPVLAAVRAARDGASLHEVTSVARRSAETTRTFFCVDTLDYLRRIGRVGAAAALFGSALMIKPLLHIVDGASRYWRRSAPAWRTWRYGRRAPARWRWRSSTWRPGPVPRLWRNDCRSGSPAWWT
jgi:DegV family protein with EDD domain